MKYIIGIDGGGTKTEAAAYSMNGKELASAKTGFGNVLINKEEAIDNIISAIDQCILKISNNEEVNQCEYIYLGLAGSEAGDASSFITKTLVARYNVKIKVVNDAVIALASLLKGEDGILTISGTGSISYGLKKEITKSAGGWGHLLGDEGSGYFIAIEALKLITLEEDLNMEPSELTKALLKKIGVRSKKDIISFVYGSTKSDIAALVPIIVEVATNGEPTAIQILKTSGQDLADTTLKVYKGLNFLGPISVGVKGSILTKVAMVRNEFERVLKENINYVTIVNEDVSPTLGAYYLAIKELEVK